MNNFNNTDQTQFSLEEPIFSNTNVEMPVEEKIIQEVPKKKFFNKKKLIIIGAILFVIFLILMIILVKNRKKTIVEVDEKESIETIENLGPFEERINDVRLDLEIADPANRDLTFPPVDMKLRLDKEKR